MKLTPVRTERGWELADETGTLESLETSEVFKTKRLAQAAIDDQACSQSHDESRSAITGDNY